MDPWWTSKVLRKHLEDMANINLCIENGFDGSFGFRGNYG